jgi:hypothetical protein
MTVAGLRPSPPQYISYATVKQGISSKLRKTKNGAMQFSTRPNMDFSCIRGCTATAIAFSFR